MKIFSFHHYVYLSYYFTRSRYSNGYENTLVAGKVGGVKTVFGTCIALLIHTLAAVIGLSALIVKSALLFSIFKYVGALYLIYIGIKALLAVRNKEGVDTNDISLHNEDEHTSCFRQGFLTNLLNPKVAVFFLTFYRNFKSKS